MIKSTDSRVHKFLEDIACFKPEQAKIVNALRKIVFQVALPAEEKIMYGGLVFVSDRMFCGIFARKNYVTVEFDCGAKMKDPIGVLEGSGKYRRHLKLYDMKDIEKKQVLFFISQSFNLPLEKVSTI